MSEQTAETLPAKLRQFADGLTPEERAPLRLPETGRVTDTWPASLWEKAQEAVAQLTPAEQAHLQQLVEDTRAAGGATADTIDHLLNLYESNASDPNAGRPRPDGMVPTGGGRLFPVSRSNLAFGLLTLVGAVAGAEDMQSQGGYYPTSP